MINKKIKNSRVDRFILQSTADNKYSGILVSACDILIRKCSYFIIRFYYIAHPSSVDRFSENFDYKAEL
jgi:hypothetical protein